MKLKTKTPLNNKKLKSGVLLCNIVNYTVGGGGTVFELNWF